MQDLSYDFDVLAERADDFGALWAVRMLYRLVSSGAALPRAWAGTMEEARQQVASFASRVGFTERESLASILLHSAELTWADSLDRMRSAPPAAASEQLEHPLEHPPPISWHLDKLSVS